MKRLREITSGSRLFWGSFFLLMAILLLMKIHSMPHSREVSLRSPVNEEKNDAEEESESLARASPGIMRIVNDHTRDTPWRSHEAVQEAATTFAKNKVVRVNDNLTMLVPDQADEASVQEESKAAQAEFALQHFSPDVLDLLYQEYKQNGESPVSMLDMLGIKKSCEAGGRACEYVVGEGAALIASLNNRLQAGDRIVSLNGESPDRLHSYDDVKSAFFRANPTVLQVRDTNNGLKQLDIPHGKALPSYYN